jgi:hypothetical protein
MKKLWHNETIRTVFFRLLIDRSAKNSQIKFCCSERVHTSMLSLRS